MYTKDVSYPTDFLKCVQICFYLDVQTCKLGTYMAPFLNSENLTYNCQGVQFCHRVCVWGFRWVEL